MNPDLDTLATTVYVTVDDLLIQHPEWVPQRPAVGIAPKLSDAELVTLAVIQSLLRYTSEGPFSCATRTPISNHGSRICLPDPPTTGGYAASASRCNTSSPGRPGTARRGMTTCGWWTPRPSSADAAAQPNNALTWGDGPNTATAPPTPATSGGCASTWWPPHPGLPTAFALAPAKADERDIATEMIAHARLARAGQTLMADKGYRSASFEEDLNEAHMTLIRPATKTEAPRSGPAVPPTLPPDHRIDLPNLQGPTRSRTSRRTHQSGCCGTCPPTDTRPSPPSSGTTKPPNDQAQHAPSSHMTTKTLELTI